MFTRSQPRRLGRFVPNKNTMPIRIDTPASIMTTFRRARRDAFSAGVRRRRVISCSPLMIVRTGSSKCISAAGAGWGCGESKASSGTGWLTRSGGGSLGAAGSRLPSRGWGCGWSLGCAAGVRAVGADDAGGRCASATAGSGTWKPQPQSGHSAACPSSVVPTAIAPKQVGQATASSGSGWNAVGGNDVVEGGRLIDERSGHEPAALHAAYHRPIDQPREEARRKRETLGLPAGQHLAATPHERPQNDPRRA